MSAFPPTRPGAVTAALVVAMAVLSMAHPEAAVLALLADHWAPVAAAAAVKPTITASQTFRTLHRGAARAGSAAVVAAAAAATLTARGKEESGVLALDQA